MLSKSRNEDGAGAITVVQDHWRLPDVEAERRCEGYGGAQTTKQHCFVRRETELTESGGAVPHAARSRAVLGEQHAVSKVCSSSRAATPSVCAFTMTEPLTLWFTAPCDQIFAFSRTDIDGANDFARKNVQILLVEHTRTRTCE